MIQKLNNENLWYNIEFCKLMDKIGYNLRIRALIKS